MSETCHFQGFYGCKSSDPGLQNSGAARIKTIIACSLQYGDGLQHSLQAGLDANENLTIKCHKTCVSRYVSSTNVKSYLGKTKSREPDQDQFQPKRLRSAVTFDFNKHCLFCREVTDCTIEYDAKVPLNRRKPACLVRTDKKDDGTSYKQHILNTCDKRTDEWATTVRQRVDGAISDLHAVNARYHTSCQNSFMKARERKLYETEDTLDTAFIETCATMYTDRKKIWNSIDIYCLYEANDGNKLTKKSLMKEIVSHFGAAVVVLSSPGLANLLVFKDEAAQTLKLVSSDDDDLNISVEKVAKQIVKECCTVKEKRSHYNMNIDKSLAQECVSDTLCELLSHISDKLDDSLPSIMIGNIVTGVVTGHPTNLQIALGIILRDHKSLIVEMHKYHVCCSYDEVLRFKYSAASAVAKSNGIAGVSSLAGISSASHGLIQIVVDNFDANISSQNCKLSTHSLAMVVTQPLSKTLEPEDKNCPILRVSKTDMSKSIEYDIAAKRYTGPKKPPMPQTAATKSIPPLALLAEKCVTMQRARETDFAFLHDVIMTNNCCEFNGYNTKLCREAGMSAKPMTAVAYVPLIDMTPSDPDTMLTALHRGRLITQEAGQDILIFTCDQQLYKVVIDIMFHMPDTFSDVLPILGGMHLLMSFVGAIGSLMAESGLKELMSGAFGGVDKMLNGKKFPHNVRALRIVVEELLRGLFNHNDLHCMTDLEQVLESIATMSRTTRIWVDLLIKPVMIMMQYCRASHESDWALHIKALEAILPYMFASGHQNYARYGLYYLRSLSRMPEHILKQFMKGEQTMHHIPGIWNGIWSDMLIESTYMRYGHGPGGIIGVTLQPSTLKTWALSMHACSTLTRDLYNIDGVKQEKVQTSHKEEASARIKSDAKDRQAVRSTLEVCIDPLNPKTHPESPVNIVTGKVASSHINLDKALALGQSQMKTFEQHLPEGFYKPISKQVITFAAKKKHIVVGETPVYDQEIIYARVIGLLASRRDVSINDVLGHELAAYAPSMFHSNGSMRISKSKSTLKAKLQVEISARKVAGTSVVLLDASAVLWTIDWPSTGVVRDFIDRFKYLLKVKLRTCHVYVVFDRYMDYSTKSGTREERSVTSRVHKLTMDTPLPSKSVVLTVTKNKVQLNNLICEAIRNDQEFLDENTQHHKLVITGDDPVPVELYNGVTITRNDIATSHEEADIILVQQAIAVAKEMLVPVSVIADDTDVFCLLVHFYHSNSITTPMVMESPIKGRVVIDIQATVNSHSNICSSLLAVHALSGCDTVAAIYGIGKGTALKVAQKGFSFSEIGKPSALIADIVKQATSFVVACYGKSTESCKSMTECRQIQWSQKTGKCLSSAPKLCTLPPTTEAFLENTKRCHFQMCQWLCAMDSDPPLLDPCQYGWEADVDNKSLIPRTVPDGTQLAPAFVLRLIRCSCSSDTPCKSNNCSCVKNHLACTMFCSCFGRKTCCNALTKCVSTDDDDDDSIVGDNV